MIRLTFSPMLGTELFWKVDANAYRKQFPNNTWKFNPYTGKERDLRDIKSDPTGLLIVPPNSDLLAC